MMMTMMSKVIIIKVVVVMTMVRTAMMMEMMKVVVDDNTCYDNKWSVYPSLSSACTHIHTAHTPPHVTPHTYTSTGDLLAKPVFSMWH